MDEKKQKKIINKCLRKLNSKSGAKIYSFSNLAQALQISLTSLHRYEINKIPEVVDLIKKNRHVKVDKKIRAKRVKMIQKNPVKNEVKINPLRSYEEIKAKLFAYRAWKQKNYAKATPSAKNLIDRQISLLEWVMMIHKTE